MLTIYGRIVPPFMWLREQKQNLLETFVTDGGKLFAFYNTDTRITNLLGVTMITWNPGDMCAIDFVPGIIPGLPDRVSQASWNFMEVASSLPSTEVIGY